MKQIGVIGCGLMGKGIIINLLKNNYDVTIYDVNEKAMIPLVEKGATQAKTVVSLAKNVDVLLLSLPSPKIIKQLLLNEVFPAMQEKSFILDMSTNDVEVTRQLANQAEKYGITFFDCPLSGGPVGADEGTLSIMVGGNKQVYPKIVPVLETIGKNIEYIGESGAGQIVKLCNNMVVGGIISLLSEVLKVGEGLGIEKEKIAELMQKGSAQNKVMDVFGPSILKEEFDDVTFSLANMVKDIRLYEHMAQQTSITSNISGAVQQLFELASKEGKETSDATVVYEMIK